MLSAFTDSVASDVEEAEVRAQLRATQIVLADTERQLRLARDKLSTYEDLKRIAAAALDINRQLEERFATQSLVLETTKADAQILGAALEALRAAEARDAQILRQIRTSAFWRTSKWMRDILMQHSGLPTMLRRMLTALRKLIR